jgi:HEAT repeat protein
MRFAAANSLGKIGDQSAVDALKAALQESDRKVVIAVAGALVTIGGDEAILSLNTAFDANNLQAVAGAYTYFISQGKAGTEQTLITSLNQYGDQYMAIAFLNCGNTQLMEAANAWAKQHNYQMITYSGSSSEAVRWGG